MKKGPKISIIVPVFNSATTIEATLNSISNQTLTDFEVIVINDASSDNSVCILNEISQKESRLKIVTLNHNVGVYEARCTGLKIAKGDFIGFVDADDFIKPNMYEVLFNTSCETNSDIVICGIDLVSNERQFLEKKASFKETQVINSSILEKFCGMKFGTGSLCNKLFRKELIMEHGLNAFRWRQDSSEDTLVNIGCFMDAKRVCLVNQSLYEYVRHPDSATQRINNSEAFTRMFRAYAIAIDQYHCYGNDVMNCITELYQRQLHYECYFVSDSSQLRGDKTLLIEAVNLIAEQYPLGLALFSNKGVYAPYQEKSFIRKIINGLKKLNEL